MRIAFEASSAISKNPTGVANYIQNFASSIDDLNEGHKLKFLYKFSRIKHKKNWYRSDSIPTQIYHNSLYPLFKNTDIVHGLDAFVPNWKGCKRVVTIHDIYPMLNPVNSISPEAFRLKKDQEHRRAVAIADLVVTVSDNTRIDVINNFQIPESKVVTVYPGVDTDFFQPTNVDEIEKVRTFYHLDNDYYLFVGAVSGKKNTAGLVEAYAHTKARNEVDLILAGSVSYLGENTLRVIEKHDLSEQVKILGYVPDEHLAALYSGAKGLLFPTFYEGFGFPILEAMLCEIPVLTSNVGSAPEVGGEFAVYVDPHEIESITSGIDKLYATTDFKIAAAKNYAQSYTWERSAKKILKIYASLLK